MAVSKKNKENKKGIYYSCISFFEDLRHRFGWQSIEYMNDYIKWGKGNDLPENIYELYLNDVLLCTIVNGIRDYVLGDGIELSEELKSYIINNMALEYKEKNKDKPDSNLTVNSKGEDLQDIIRQSIEDYILLGTYTNDIYYNFYEKISEEYYIDVMKFRFLQDRDKLRYKKYGWHGDISNQDIIDLYLFNEQPEYNDKGEKIKKVREIFMHYNPNSRTVYPLPTFYAALDSIEIDRDITLFHKNGLKNGFSQFRVLKYPGVPSEEEQQKIVSEYEATYTGVYNAGGTFIVFDNGTGQTPEIVTAPEDNIDKKYDQLEQTIMNRIFCAFRAQPVLFGILTKTTGFSEQEFFECFKLFLNTVIKPIRNEFIRDYSYKYGIKNAFSFIPTSLEKQLENIGGNNNVPE